ncbi:hypothetical protein HK103_007104 [Boothiomyces macroporosus]|uniref:Pentatricopeptide repeat-containing protein n=1 Tax=Boothiomyces macroporosus TaxID=261099 RepID=A0AAD5UD01_9FUNG|nr:hypothetical protein HK103_007104 [Boothiomyces macroporosus]
MNSNSASNLESNLDEMLKLYPFKIQKKLDKINLFYFNVLEMVSKSENISLFQNFVFQLAKREIDLQESKKILELYRKVEIKPQQKLYYRILFNLAKKRPIEEVLEWIQIMQIKVFGIEQTTIAEYDDLGNILGLEAVQQDYNDYIKHALMISMIKHNDLQSAIKLSNPENIHHRSTVLNGKLMKNPESVQFKRDEFNLVMYSIMLKYHFYKKNLDQITILFNEILKHQQPTTFLLNIMVQGYFENDRVREGLNLFHRYSDFNIQPDSITFTIILHYCTVKKLYRTCFGIYHQLCLLNIHISLELWSVIIQMYVKQGDLKEAWNIFNEYKHYQPNRIVQGILMNGLIKDKQYNKVVELYNQLYEIGDDDVTRRYLIMALHHFGKEKKIIQLYEDSLRNVNQHTVGLFIRMCQLYKDNPDILLVFYRQMQNLNLSTIPILNILISSLAEQNRNFKDYLSILMQNNAELHQKTYHDILLYYSNKNDWARINQIYDYPEKEESLFSFTMLLKANLSNPHKFKQILEQNAFGKDQYLHSVLILFNHLHGTTQDILQAYNECKHFDSQVVLSTVVTCLIERDERLYLKRILKGKNIEPLYEIGIKGINTKEYLDKYIV